MVYYIGNIPCGQNELYHYGILGMKWGVRRYQNKDGSLTQAGKRRYNVSDMSDQELQSRINRVRMEQEYDRLTRVEKKPSKLKKALGYAAAELGKAAIRGAADKLAKRISADNDPDKELKTKVSRLELEKRYRDLSNKDPDLELKSRINRLELEKRYRDLSNNDKMPEYQRAAQKVMKNIGNLTIDDLKNANAIISNMKAVEDFAEGKKGK